MYQKYIWIYLKDEYNAHKQLQHQGKYDQSQAAIECGWCMVVGDQKSQLISICREQGYVHET